MAVRARRLVLLGAACLAAIGCEQRTELVVVSHTDLAVPDEIERIRFVVRGPEGSRTEEAVADFGQTDPPAVLGLVHGGGPLGPFVITAVGEQGGDEVLRRRARTSFVRGRTLELRMDLLRSCVGTTCGEGQTCTREGCVSQDVSPDDLPQWQGSPGRFDGSVPMDGGNDAGAGDGGTDAGGDAATDAGSDAAVDAAMDASVDAAADAGDGVVDGGTDAGCSGPSDCDDGIACTVDECTAGACSFTPDHRSCARGEICDTTAGGCAAGATFTEVYSIVTAECSPCHTSGPMYSGELDMSTREMAHSELVDVAAICGTGNIRVIPRDSATSLLWRKVADVDLCGDRMPFGRSKLTEAEIATIAEWIDAGAADN